jgi:ABC-type dipeptide/oligopeptide/nickel transport system ATPase component
VTLLYVHALTVVDAGGRRLIDQLSLHLDGGQVLGLTGGAKTGKSLLCDILAGARPGGVEIASGRILLGDRDLVIEHDEPDGAIADWRPGDSSGNTRVAICRDASVFCDIDRPANARHGTPIPGRCWMAAKRRAIEDLKKTRVRSGSAANTEQPPAIGRAPPSS